MPDMLMVTFAHFNKDAEVRWDQFEHFGCQSKKQRCLKGDTLHTHSCSGSVMFWGCFNSRGPGALVKINDIMDSTKYQAICGNFAWQSGCLFGKAETEGGLSTKTVTQSIPQTPHRHGSVMTKSTKSKPGLNWRLHLDLDFGEIYFYLMNVWFWLVPLNQ